MCILFIYTDPAPETDGYRLIIGSNRDEFYKRPAKKAFKCDRTHVIAGRDMEIGRENGTWLGVSTHANEHKYRFGALLNVTGETKNSHKGRGFIVVDYLENAKPIDEYQDDLHKDDEAYHSYNFVTVDLGLNIKISHTTNVGTENDVAYEGKQCLAFGNSTVTSPLCKVNAGKLLFKSIIDKFNNRNLSGKLCYQLIQLLKSQERHLPDDELKRRAPNSFEDLSAIYVQMIPEGYGTRTHTVIMVDYDWNLHFKEVTMQEPINANSPTWEETNIIYPTFTQ